MFAELRQDSARYAHLGGWASSPGFWLGAVYRLGVRAHAVRNPLLRLVAVMLYRIVKLPWRVLYNVSIPPTARIGPGLCLIHPNNVLLAPGVVIGENCLLFHEVTLGTGPSRGVPTLGDNVDVYVGARILGGVTIGTSSMIGANCVVTRNIPPESVVAAQPIRVLPRTLGRISSRADERKAKQALAQAAPEPVGEAKVTSGAS